MPQQPVTLTLSAKISDKTFPISDFTINIPIDITRQEVGQHLQDRRRIHHAHHNQAAKHGRTHHTIHQCNQGIQNGIRNRPRRGRGGEILKTRPERHSICVVATPLPDE